MSAIMLPSRNIDIIPTIAPTPISTIPTINLLVIMLFAVSVCSASAACPPLSASPAGISPFTSSSNDTPNIVLSFTSLSKSGTALLFSHLDTDCLDTLSCSAKSPCESFFSLRRLYIVSPKFIFDHPCLYCFHTQILKHL